MSSKAVVDSMRQAKKALAAFMRNMPDEDSYAMVYCIAFDAAKVLASAMKEIPPALREAKVDSKATEQMRNHAKAFLRPKRKAKKNEG